MSNYFDISMPAIGENEGFARNVVASFALACSPTVDELNDVKTAVSEAVTNAVVHAYDEDGIVQIKCELDKANNAICISVIDFGRGIADVRQALEPFYTSKPDQERSGMGFTIIESFMDEMSVETQIGKGTCVKMRKVFAKC